MKALLIVSILAVFALGGCAKPVSGTLGQTDLPSTGVASDGPNVLRISPGSIQASGPTLQAEMSIGSRKLKAQGPQLEARLGLSQSRAQ